jgi:glutamate synthase domain-containing protein 3
VVKKLLSRHAKLTGSRSARAVLDAFDTHAARIVKVMPHEYRKALALARSQGESRNVSSSNSQQVQ